MNTESKTTTYTLSAFFADENDAEDATKALMDVGIPKDVITMTPGNRPDVPPIDHLGFLDALTGIFFHEEQRAAYAEALQLVQLTEPESTDLSQLEGLSIGKSVLSIPAPLREWRPPKASAIA
ncbi:hypothetical protein [Rhizobium sp. RCC_161_2]|uniref:hypothetical protein n=1 Tax=Rhizobium sp. RCC_161_2 TaxID=3239219 RepID=UPI003525AE85